MFPAHPRVHWQLVDENRSPSLQLDSWLRNLLVRHSEVQVHAVSIYTAIQLENPKFTIVSPAKQLLKDYLHNLNIDAQYRGTQVVSHWSSFTWYV